MTLNVLAVLIFLSSHAFWLLVLARFISGLGIGLLTATATAHLTELRERARLHESPGRAAAVATAANVGGIGLGPLAAGAFAEFTDRPLFAPYLVLAMFMCLGLLAFSVVPETAGTRPGRWRYRPQRVSLPSDARSAYWAAGVIIFASSATFGFFTSLAPSFLANTLDLHSPLLAGAVTFAVPAAAAITQICTSTWGIRPLTWLGVALFSTGLLVVVAAALTASFALFLAGGITAGAGAAFRGSIAITIKIAPIPMRGAALAGMFVFSDAGTALPVIGLGLLLQAATLTAIATFGIAMLVLLIPAALAMNRTS